MNLIKRLARSLVVEPRPVKPVVVGSNPTVPAISRRGFLAGALATPVIAVPAVKYFFAPKGGWPVSRYIFEAKGLGYAIDPKLVSDTEWFIKPEDRNGIALISRAHPMSAAAFRAAMAECLNKVWAEEYDKHADEWAELYQSEFPSISLDSLEEIEIEIPEPSEGWERPKLLPTPSGKRSTR